MNRNLKASLVQGMAVVVTSLLLSAVGSAARRERLMTQESLPDEPIQISEVRVKGQPVQFGRRFVADERWLNGLKFVVKNVSPKAISHITLLIEQSVPGAPTFEIILRKGYFDPFAEKPTGEGPPVVAPGMAAELTLDGEEYKTYIDSLPEEFKGPAVPLVNVRIHRAVFEDGSMWYKGMLHYRNPDRPSSWYPAPGEKERFIEKMHRGRSAQTALAVPNAKPAGSLGEHWTFPLFQPASYTAGLGGAPPRAAQVNPCVNYFGTSYGHCGFTQCDPTDR